MSNAPLAAGVERMLTIGSGDGPPESVDVAIRLADRFSMLYASIGVHPHDASKATPDTYRRFAELATHPKVVAVGEIGLDYHYDHSPRDVQRDVFTEQMRIASDARKPIVIHTREAWADTVALIRQHWNPSCGGVIHCFSEGPAEAQEALDLGFHISFSGLVTFPKAAGIHEAARLTPGDWLLVETDAPFLAQLYLTAVNATSPPTWCKPPAALPSCEASRRSSSPRQRSPTSNGSF